jgi:hypothetical protein
MSVRQMPSNPEKNMAPLFVAHRARPV